MTPPEIFGNIPHQFSLVGNQLAIEQIGGFECMFIQDTSAEPVNRKNGCFIKFNQRIMDQIHSSRNDLSGAAANRPADCLRWFLP